MSNLVIKNCLQYFYLMKLCFFLINDASVKIIVKNVCRLLSAIFCGVLIFFERTCKAKHEQEHCKKYII